MRLTGWLPDVRPVLRARGFVLRPCFRACGRDLQVCSGTMIVYPSNVSLGDHVFMAYGCWIQGYGRVTLEDEVMLGPYTVLASSDHTVKAGSYRFGDPRSAAIVMKRGSWTGAHVVITAGCTVGTGAACAAGAVVTRDVPDDTVVGGVPARPLTTTNRPTDTCA